ncbi:Hypothetical_protein [Hexamita inflata]|uniref:Hypothetical_protein n=1 Tax=Hexamita inflata TaxID=28002 RepID=A0ABP1GVF8_9EUKA
MKQALALTEFTINRTRAQYIFNSQRNLDFKILLQYFLNILQPAQFQLSFVIYKKIFKQTPLVRKSQRRFCEEVQSARQRHARYLVREECFWFLLIIGLERKGIVMSFCLNNNTADSRRQHSPQNSVKVLSHLMSSKLDCKRKVMNDIGLHITISKHKAQYITIIKVIKHIIILITTSHSEIISCQDLNFNTTYFNHIPEISSDRVE